MSEEGSTLQALETYWVRDEQKRETRIQTFHSPIGSDMGSYFVAVDGKVNQDVAATYMFLSGRYRAKETFDRKLNEYLERKGLTRVE